MSTLPTTPSHTQTIESLLVELKEVSLSFHAVLDTFSDDQWQKQSLNPGWKNNEIFAHMVFGFIVLKALFPMARAWGRLPKGSSKPFARLLNAITKPFNLINGVGARMQSKVFTYKRIGKIFDGVINSLVRKFESVKAEEWERGMYYPTNWDPNFSDFRTLDKLARYPIVHYHFHLNQLSRETYGD